MPPACPDCSTAEMSVTTGVVIVKRYDAVSLPGKLRLSVKGKFTWSTYADDELPVREELLMDEAERELSDDCEEEVSLLEEVLEEKADPWSAFQM